MSFSATNKLKTQNDQKLYSPSKEIGNFDINECIWALNYPEIQKACYLAGVCSNLSPKFCRYKNINSSLQNGPTCGLTAINMVLFKNSLDMQELILLAKEKGYTLNGEMFSAENVCQLLCHLSKVKKLSLSSELHKGRLYQAGVKEKLRNGSCILVPYDPDFNHQPCLKHGHKAHWALVIGFLIDDNDEFYVFSRHGKTKNIAIWSLKALSASNSNLIEFAQPKGYPDMECLLPQGGIGGEHGLKNRSIIINGIDADEIIVI